MASLDRLSCSTGLVGLCVTMQAGIAQVETLNEKHHSIRTSTRTVLVDQAGDNSNDIGLM